VRPCEAGDGGTLAEVLSLKDTSELASLEVIHTDLVTDGNAEPVAVGGEDKAVDRLVTLVAEGVEVLGVGEVPEGSNTVFPAGSAQGAIGGDAHAGDVTGVGVNGVLVGPVPGEGPDLHLTVVTTADNNGLVTGGGEAHARHPIGVGVLREITLCSAMVFHTLMVRSREPETI